MSDIFISYSRKDSHQAEHLERQLRSAGFSCWIDKVGIEAATTWSGEIVDAIEECKAFVVLLSPNSIQSHNVVKEVSLAAEHMKKILPIDVEQVDLPRDMKYHLAGIQRAPLEQIDAIIRALGKLGVEASHHTEQVVTHTPKARPAANADRRKSLMILPFEDLSPTGDNGWFADGIVSELISALSNVKALKVADTQATKEFKKYHGQLSTYAKEMQIRYFVQGDVRKFGDNIKISSRLLDIDSGDYLWQDSLKGTMNDIFEIQEDVAKKVTDGLNIILTREEKKKLAERGTENAEAYELQLKASEYFGRNTKEGYRIAAQLFSEAIALDPDYAEAYSYKANALANLYRSYDRDPKLLEEGLSLIHEAKRIKPELWNVNNPLSLILTMQGKMEEAEFAAQEYIRNAPDDFGSHFALGFFYNNTGQGAKAIAPFEEAAKLKPEYLTTLFNLVLACHNTNATAKQKEWALVAIPKVEKHLKLFPDDEKWRVNHALFLHWADRDEAAKYAARKLSDLRDGVLLFNTACLHAILQDYDSSLETFRKSIEAGFQGVLYLKDFLEDTSEGIGSLKGTPEWESARELVEKMEAEEAAIKSA